MVRTRRDGRCSCPLPPIATRGRLIVSEMQVTPRSDGCYNSRCSVKTLTAALLTLYPALPLYLSGDPTGTTTRPTVDK
jgi:hypothetical protein